MNSIAEEMKSTVAIFNCFMQAYLNSLIKKKKCIVFHKLELFLYFLLSIFIFSCLYSTNEDVVSCRDYFFLFHFLKGSMYVLMDEMGDHRED